MLLAEELARLEQSIFYVPGGRESQPSACAGIAVRDDNPSRSSPRRRAQVPGIKRVRAVEGESPLVVHHELRPAGEVRLEALVDRHRIPLDAQNLLVEFLVRKVKSAVEDRRE